MKDLPRRPRLHNYALNSQLPSFVIDADTRSLKAYSMFGGTIALFRKGPIASRLN